MIAAALLALAALHAADVPAAAAPAVVAQDAGAPFCKKCSNTGRILCPEHDKDLCQREDGVLYCSVIADCPACKGAGWTDCGSCVNAELEARLQLKLASVEERRAKLAYIDKDMGRAIRKCETEHFVVGWEVDRLKVGKKFLESHELLHLYAERMETVYKDYRRDLRVKDEEFKEKFRVFVWTFPEDHRRASGAFCGATAPGGMKKMGTEPTYSVCGSRQNFNTDEQLHRNLVHCVAHLVLSAHVHAEWMGRYKAGWYDEGLAHWFEDKYWDICDNYCYQEQNTNVGFKSGRWRLAVRQLVEKDAAPAAAGVFEQTSDSLSLEQNAVAFSYVDYLIWQDPEKFVQLGLRLKKKMATRDALKEVYGLGVMEFEANWKSHVLATYPKR